MAVSRQGDIIGYGCRNVNVDNTDMHHIAPLYAESYDIARDLLHELTCDVIGQALVIFIM